MSLAHLLDSEPGRPPDPRDSDYFRGYVASLPHPMMTSTGSEGRCDICSGYSDDRRHEEPWERPSIEEFLQRRHREQTPLRIPPPQVTDTSYPARQARLDAIQPAKSSTPGENVDKVDKAVYASPKEDTPMNVTRRWGTDHLVRALFEQDKNWITAKGETVAVAEMTPRHAFNTLLMLERTVGDLPFDREDLQEKPLYQALYGRVTGALPMRSKDFPGAPITGYSRQAGPVTSGTWVRTREGIKSLLSGASFNGRAVELDYTDAGFERGTRNIRVFSLKDDYIVAKNLDKDELRTYRLDRINRVRYA